MKYKLKITSILLTLLLCYSGNTLNAQETRGGIKFKVDPLHYIQTETSLQYRHKNEETMDSKRLMGEFDVSTKILKYIEPGVIARYMYCWNKTVEESEYNNDKIQLSAYAKIPVKFKNVEFSYRPRYQYSYLSESKTKEYFRNKLMLKYEPTSNMETYFSYELFYNLNDHCFDQRRLKLKVDLELSKRYELSGFYIIDFVHETNFYTYYITGLEMTIKF